MTMRNKTFTLLGLSILTLVVLISCVSATSLSEWNLTTDGSAINVNSVVTAGTFGSTGVTFNAFGVNGANAENWPTANAVDVAKYFEVTIAPKTDYTLTISNINFDYSSSIVGPASFELQYSKLASFASPTSLIIKDDVSSTEATSSNSSLSISVSSGETLTIRWFGYDFDAITNEFRIKDLKILGTVTGIPRPEEVDECITTGSTGNLKLSIEDFSVEKGYGEDNEWFPLDEVQIEVEVENKGDEKIRNVAIGWGLYNVDTEEWVIDDIESDFNLGDDTKETVYINFKLDDVNDFEEGADYVFYVWAEGEDNNLDPELDTCVWASDEISIEIESDFVVLDNFEYSETISCGSTVQIMADVFNIGDSDQDEVSVQVYNKKLELFKTLDIGDINAFDNEVLSLEFEVPQDAEEGWYALEFTVYDEDNDVYENNYDDEQSTLDLLVKIEGGCIVIPKVSISASLISGGMSGEQMVVKATVSNTGTSIKEYSLSATGYTGWASSVALDAETFNLGAGQSKEVLFTFDINRDASGTQLFDIEVVSEGQLELKQPVQVSITKKAGFLTGNMISEGNWYVWGIGALNVLLILIIIIVAIKVAKK